MEQKDILDTGDMLNFDTNVELSGNEILPSELVAGLKEMKSGKSPGNDDITKEPLTWYSKKKKKIFSMLISMSN